MKTPWQRLGFRETPYNSQPLASNADDAVLHVGRNAQSAQFLAQVECRDGCVLVVSGDAGLGKTSFLNVLQYRIRMGEASISKRLMPCYRMTTAEQDTTPSQLARRIAHNLVASLEIEAKFRRQDLPPNVRKIRDWLSHEGVEAGRALGFQIAGMGAEMERSIAVTAVAEATVENWRDILETLANSVKSVEGFHGAFVCIDNAETLSVKELTKILMVYRDTLFQIPGIWWVIVGQKNLYAQIERENNRVSQRIRGSGIEIPPLSLAELHLLVETRVKTLREKVDAKSPFSAEVHGLLMDASCGQPRYVLSAGDELFVELIGNLLETIEKPGSTHGAAREFRDKMVDEALQQVLKDNQVPDGPALGFLRQSVERRLNAKGLVGPSLAILKAIAEHPVHVTVRADEIEVPGLANEALMEALELLAGSDLLFASEFDGKTCYQLKGDAWFCNHFDLWDAIKPPTRPMKPSKQSPRPLKTSKRASRKS